MAKAGGVVWLKPPAGMALALDKYGDRVPVAVQAVAQFIATKMQNEARKEAKWQDRTGNARSGLFAVTRREAAGKVVALYLSHGHTVYYGIFLEMGLAGRYAVIQPTIEKYLPEIKKMLDDIFR